MPLKWQTGRSLPRFWRGWRMDMGQLKKLRQFIREEDGMGTVEVILIIVVLVGLVIIFKDQITRIINDLFSKITKQTKKI